MRKDQLVVVGILVSIVALFLLAFYLPNAACVQDMKDQLKQGRDKMRQDQQTARTLQRLATEVGELQTMVKAMDTQLPADPQLDQFLNSLTVRMEAESLELLGIKPEPMQKGKELDELSIQVGFEGSFSGTFRFLRRLESMPRVARVDHLQLVTPEGSRSGRLTGTMRLCTFVLHRPGPGGADGRKPGRGSGRVAVVRSKPRVVVE